MSLNTTQLQTLKSAIAAGADPAFVALRTANDETGMAAWYNAASNPAYTVWRSSVSRDDVTGEGFDWTQVDNLTAGQARIWELLFQTSTGSIKPADAGKRAGIQECWKGTAPKVAVATFVLNACKRTATRAEALFATGSGTSGTPSVLGWEGFVSAQIISDALRA